MIYTEILGIGAYAPKAVMTNFDLEKLVETSDEWIQSRTGIANRHVSEGENTSDLALKAAIAALKDASMEAEDLDMILLATTSPDHLSPSTAGLVQKKIGAKNAVAMDISAGCTGFVYGLDLAKNLIASGSYQKILVIGAEVLSKHLDWTDRNTCILFGDGAGAAVVAKSERNGLQDTKIYTDGDLNDLIVIPTIPVKNPMGETKADYEALSMKGQDVFKFATKVVAKSLKEMMKKHDLTNDDIRWVVPHQANKRIFDFAASKLKMDPEKFYLNLNEYGNTSAASIPLALSEMNQKGLLAKGDKILLVGFGAGLTWGTALIQW
ncbi:ketoacyl-ACP synthase III [Gottschalkiaceae bacterium SANA]|nr:ketoacyl-ACP synthase III [Gottschalkiaceae bacterium SANA]